MKTLLLLRHAKSSGKDDGLDDHDRPLNKRGKRDAPRMGALLSEYRLVPEVIVTSTAKRARKTAKKVAMSSDYNGETIERSELYHASPKVYLKELRRLSDDVNRAMLVGHNPGLEEFLELLSGTYEVLPTAAIVHLTAPVTSWQDWPIDGSANLHSIWRPKEMLL